MEWAKEAASEWLTMDWAKKAVEEACDFNDYTSAYVTLLQWFQWWRTELDGKVNALPQVASTFWRTADPLAVVVGLSLLLGALSLLLSIPTRNYSWVDRMWTLAPIAYLWRFALHDRLTNTGFGGGKLSLSPRLLAMAGLVSVWGARLTYNFARKGGYRWSGEDYRWPYLRARIIRHPLLFFLFNTTFISFIQHLLLAALTTPAYLAWQNLQTPLNAIDGAAIQLGLFFIIFEAIADQQQWAFQSAKHAKLAARKRLTAEQARGFATSGLFRYSRHPNFWAEQCFWWSIYLFGVAASGKWLNWTVVAPIGLMAIFQGSTWLTEKISMEKYPAYHEYRQTTSRFLPWPPAEPVEAPAAAAATTPRSTRKAAAAAAAATPAAAAASEGKEEQAVAAAAPTPATARQRRGRAARAAKEEAEQEAEQAAAPTATKPSRGRAARAAKAEAVEEEQPAAAAKPSRGRAARATKAAKAAEAAAEEEEEEQAAEPAPAARPSRASRKTARAVAAEEEAPAPVRHSSRLSRRTAAS